jgi:MYXO-CTERM domain-containing protein
MRGPSVVAVVIAAIGGPAQAGTIARMNQPVTSEAALDRAVTARAGHLRRAREFQLPRGRLVVYRQEHRGLPVVGAGAVARVDQAGRLRWLNWSAPPIDLATTPTVDQAAALARAGGGRAALMVHAIGRPRLAWRVDAGATRTWVDARSGRIIDRHHRRFSALGDVFEVSPAETPGLVRVPLALPDGAERLETDAFRVLNCPDLDDCHEIYPNTFFHACSPVPLATPDAGGDFLYPFTSDTDPADLLPEVMAFYQVDKALALARELGFDRLSQPLEVIVNYHQYDATSLEDCGDGDYDGEVPLEPFDNAYFTADGQGIGVDHAGFALVLSQGHTVDYALDGDVVQHELGHALMASLHPDLGRTILDRFGTDPSPGGVHEGMSDLLTAMVTGDPEIGEYVGSGKGDGGPLRDLGEEASCPADLVGEAHADSRPLTSGFWRARQLVGAGDPARERAFDGAVMAAWIGLGDRGGYERAGSLLVAELEVALDAEAAELARTVLSERGVLGCGARVVDGAAGKPRSAFPGIPDLERGGTQPGPFQLRYELERSASALAVEVATYDANAPELTRAAVQLKPDGPIEWREEEDGPVSDAIAEVPLEVDGERRARAVFPGPFEPGVYYLMPVNHGSRATLHDTRVNHAEADPDDGGCGCRTASGAPTWPTWPLWLLLLLSASAGRGRRRDRGRCR